ncbi:GNAT family N-acetyltransferase [Nostoc sphaeroides]|uniref:GNAT family acetyltransferase n=1 Tax=Nostoc sphaeroides CCNUC1 TaxID=2653204 RepID=A0A5P8WB84_9NOSO|nr:hypothetical protein [Nostoc sphaeroides]QFS49940.1 GNAT family acetyltransferase [Nostoc sphaeroides CCNUC1]
MLELINPTCDLHSEFIDMVAEYQEYGELRLFDQTNLPLIQENFSAYIQYLENNSKGIALKPGFVPATTFWLVAQRKLILGESQLRHWLVPNLEHRGGHIGYMTAILILKKNQIKFSYLNRELVLKHDFLTDNYHPTLEIDRF